MDNNKEFKSQDFYQSVVLKTLGFQLLRLEKGSGHFFIFVFSDSEAKAEEIIEEYWNRKVKVDARDLIETINELKTRIHSGI